MSPTDDANQYADFSYWDLGPRLEERAKTEGDRLNIAVETSDATEIRNAVRMRKAEIGQDIKTKGKKIAPKDVDKGMYSYHQSADEEK